MKGRGQDRGRSIGLLILRLGIGGFMAAHGWGKLGMVLRGDAAGFGDPIGLGPAVSLYLVTFAELICALLVVLGLGTRFVAAPVVFAMAVAAFVVHAQDPWTMGRGAELFLAGKAKMWSSKEPALLFLSAFLALIFTGPGAFSLDARIRGRR
jgi:putative oxidoreductase